MNAVCDGDFSKVDHMVKAGIPVDACDEYGRTALIRAAMHNQTDVVRYLLGKAANVNKQERGGWTALHAASRYNRTDVMRILLQHRAKTDIKDNYGDTPIAYARYWHHKEAIDLLERY